MHGEPVRTLVEHRTRKRASPCGTEHVQNRDKREEWMSSEKTSKKQRYGVGSVVAAWWNALGCLLSNLRRRMRRGARADFPLIELEGELTERTPQQPWWAGLLPSVRSAPTSLEYLHDALHAIAADPDTRGVVLHFNGPDLSLAQAQSLTQLFDRFRTWDQQYHRTHGAHAPGQRKQIIVHAEELSMAAYVAACAADRVYLTPLTDWTVLGLRVGATYLKETLAHAGIDFDVIKIAPWKSAGDRVSCARMSPESREQFNWLLDSLYTDIVCAIARGRKLSEARVRALIDSAPLSAADAAAADLIDGVLYADELPHLLSNLAPSPAPPTASANDKQPEDEKSPSPRPPATVKPYEQVKKLMLRRPMLRPRRAVGLISVGGAIVTGKSRNLPFPLPLLGDRQMGSRTVQQLVRAARANPRLAAVVLHVDSPGGSALASDLIWRELTLLASEKPLVVYMGDTAASGGYYIATPAHTIVAQSATLTGSIGVINMKPNTAGTYAKLDARVETVQRGTNADLFSTDRGWDEQQREKMEASVRHVYGEFKERVAAGRSLDYAELDPICNGRVWTGAQARAHGLVDELGDLALAVERACALAELPTDGRTRVIPVEPPKTPHPATPLQELLEPEELANLRDLRTLAADLLAGDWRAIFGSEQCWLIADELPRIE